MKIKNLNAITYILAILMCLILIIWSYAEEGFYRDYIKGSIYLVWTVYILPWVIIGANIAHYVITKRSDK